MTQNHWGISEKQLEDWVCANPAIFSEDTEILARQVRLEHGILDVLAYNGNALVVELKARPLKERDVGQVLRYTHDVTRTMQRISMFEEPLPYPPFLPNHLPPTFPSAEAANYHINYFSRHGVETRYDGVLDRPIVPVLFGIKVDNKVFVAAQAAGILIYLWSYNEAKKTIEVQCEWLRKTRENAERPQWADLLHHRITRDCAQETLCGVVDRSRMICKN